MGEYVCSVCEYIYDEAKGIPEAGIAPGTSWGDLPDNWTCPQCGATKAEFTKQGEPTASDEKNPISQIEASSDFKEMSPSEIRALCKNLARGCEKQYKPEEAALFNELADYFKVAATPAKNPDFDQLLVLIEKDLEDYLPNAKAVAADVKDRGALRALTWDEKVTRILKSLLTRYQDKGEDMLENTGVYVCTICGFIYVGDNLSDVCPVCKVPNWKFEKVEGR
jgi:rubredoxin